VVGRLVLFFEQQTSNHAGGRVLRRQAGLAPVLYVIKFPGSDA